MCGSSKQGRPKLRFKDTPKSKLKWSRISPRELEASAADRSAWRSLTSRRADAFEEDRRQRLAAARDRRHRAASASTRATDYRCDTCGRLCASNFGLRSHMRSHPWEHRLCHRRTPTDYEQSASQLSIHPNSQPANLYPASQPANQPSTNQLKKRKFISATNKKISNKPTSNKLTNSLTDNQQPS